MRKTFFIVSGGTGGHIIPARCLAENLALKNHQAIFFGDENYRKYIKEEDQFPSYIIKSSKLVKKPISLFFAALKITYGVIQSLYFLLRFQPKFIIAFGGYSTFPMLIAGLLTGKKIILHEQNSHLGKVNRIFAKFATKIALSFQETSGLKSEFKSKSFFTGNPVRAEIVELNKIEYATPEQKEVIAFPQEKRMGYDVLLSSDFHKGYNKESKDMFNILVIGGSGGAKIFSEILPKAFFNLSDSLKSKINIIQQCRSELMKSTFEQY